MSNAFTRTLAINTGVGPFIDTVLVDLAFDDRQIATGPGFERNDRIYSLLTIAGENRLYRFSSTEDITVPTTEHLSPSATSALHPDNDGDYLVYLSGTDGKVLVSDKNEAKLYQYGISEREDNVTDFIYEDTINIPGVTHTNYPMSWDGMYLVMAVPANVARPQDTSFRFYEPPPPLLEFRANRAYAVREGDDTTIEITDFSPTATAIAFTSGYTPPSWLSISGTELVITNAEAVTADTEFTVQLTVEDNHDINADIEGTITIEVLHQIYTLLETHVLPNTPHLSGMVSNPDPLARPQKIGYDKENFPAATFLVLAYSNEDRPRRYDVTDFTQNVPYPEDYFFPTWTSNSGVIFNRRGE